MDTQKLTCLICVNKLMHVSAVNLKTVYNLLFWQLPQRQENIVKKQKKIHKIVSLVDAKEAE